MGVSSCGFKSRPRHQPSQRGDVAKWLRRRSAKPLSAVRIRPSPPAPLFVVKIPVSGPKCRRFADIRRETTPKPLTKRTLVSYNGGVTGREFTRRARRYARRHGLSFRFDPSRGKGSHGTVYLGNHQTRVQYGEIASGTFYAMLRQLGIPREEL